QPILRTTNSNPLTVYWPGRKKKVAAFSRLQFTRPLFSVSSSRSASSRRRPSKLQRLELRRAQHATPLSGSFVQAADASGFSRGLLPVGHLRFFFPDHLRAVRPHRKKSERNGQQTSVYLRKRSVTRSFTAAHTTL